MNLLCFTRRSTSSLWQVASRRPLFPALAVPQRGFTTKRNEEEGQQFNPRLLGITSEVFIPTSYRNLPSFFSHPIVVCNSLIRRLYVLGFNTVKIALFRSQTGVKPSFLLWKNKAIETYIQVNKAFASKSIKSMRLQLSVWVEESLASRISHLPKNMSLDWQIKKFNKVPKLVLVEPVMMPGKPLEHIQLIYKFDTTQELIKLDKVTKKTEKELRDIVDYMVFLCDVMTNEMILLGSVFESKPNAKLPSKQNELDKKGMLKRMKECSDLFRLPPQ
ncbi:hypothetical protein KAFR_0I00740 [Kazachstania africana CBS 2517]|uniref:MBA1-like protein n=1 Tax=Kazachstania africana (strain ATCC 22294 / BCRC 22015 / CBS 2517 / CECT 1963 / NBRC 1671 / NRRL Y-8276) TaxID=1071382 RepID=H2AZQ5_KAZAF|nr:hypothetical protein KAFR_0I00740 [Kazachstania africana CBS 2517]CCF59855.1 hypothetical protein KAFR_0I00740 [Kazachstania africana CBS 2517]